MSEKKKYIVEAGDDIQLITLTGVKNGSAITITGVIDTLETAEKLEEEAYKRGHDTGYKKCLSEHEFDMPCSICDDYERGLNDAWDAAKKLAMMDTETSEDVTGYFGLFRILENLTPGEAISKLRAYEEEKDKIHVGDEIKQVSDSGIPTGLVCVVTRISGDGMSGISSEGYTVFCNSQVNRYWKKTGRHFDIESILKEMQS